ncbi:MAG TPA: patatin-like phospholipase family protein, partial [Candidatus Krumholzibacterium sp.]|nr:patatin-like phospholipase family protein [Candidatus Krumholzibacterium sp.]
MDRRDCIYQAVIFLLLIVLPGLAPAFGQGGAPPGGRPKIGLALSGGGARGLAHIGALKVIEELRIPVDYIAGTSMGSIVGGLYASGLSPGEIEKAILDIDWDDLFTDRMKRTERTFRRKEDDGVQFFNFELGLKGIRPVMSSGLVAGQKLALAFDVDEIYTTDRQDFDDLKIPFRAVATDLDSGEMVVIGDGSLVHAVRASMSIPGVFAPVHFQDRYLVDGGLVRNLPCDVVKDMGADIVIAVDVGALVEGQGEGTIQSLADVSRQSFNIIIRETSRSVLGLADVYIPLGLEKISAADFQKAASIMAEGESATRGFTAELSGYSASEADYAAFLEKHRHSEAKPVVIGSIILNNLSRVEDSEIERRVSIAPGDTLDRRQLRDDFLRLYELGIFESVEHRLVDDGEGTDLLIEVREKFYSPNILNLGVDYIDDLDGRSDFAVLARYSRLEMNRFGGELRADLRLGLSRGFRAGWYQPVEPTRTVFLAPFAEAVTSTRNIYSGDHKTSEYQTRYIGAGLDAGFQFGKFIELRVGFRQRRINTVVDVGEADLPEEWKSR